MIYMRSYCQCFASFIFINCVGVSCLFRAFVICCLVALSISILPQEFECCLITYYFPPILSTLRPVEYPGPHCDAGLPGGGEAQEYQPSPPMAGYP